MELLKRDMDPFCGSMLNDQCGNGENEFQPEVQFQAPAPPQGDSNLNLGIVPVGFFLSPDNVVPEAVFVCKFTEEHQQAIQSFQLQVPSPSDSEMSTAEQFPVTPPEVIQNMMPFHQNSDCHSPRNFDLNHDNDEGELVNIQVQSPPDSYAENTEANVVSSTSTDTCDGMSNKNKSRRHQTRTRRAKICNAKKTSPLKRKPVPLYDFNIEDCANNTDLKKQVQRAKNAKMFHENRKEKAKAGEKILELFSKCAWFLRILNENPKELELMKTNFPHLLPREIN